MLTLGANGYLKQQIFSYNRGKVNEGILWHKLTGLICIFFPEGIQFIKLRMNGLQEPIQAAHTFNLHRCLKIPLNQNTLHHTVNSYSSLKMFKSQFGFELKMLGFERKRPKRTDRLINNKTYVNPQRIF